MPTPRLTSEEEARYGEDKRPALIGSLVTFLILNNLAVVSRCWVQWKTARQVFIDDFAILVAAICVDVIIANLLASAHSGLGLHTWRINTEDTKAPKNVTKVFLHVWVTMVFTGPTFTAIKISLLYFYRRLFLVHQRWLRLAWWVNLIYVILWFFGSTGFYLFQCWPPEWYWLQYYKKYKEPTPGSIKHGQCKAQSVIHVALPLIFGLASDVAILCLPMSALYSLQMGKRKKVAMVLLFAIGTLACTLELVRIIELWVGTDDHADPAWGDVNFLILSAAEEVTAVMCACLPVVGPQLFKEVRKFRESRIIRVGSSSNGYSSSRSWKHGFKRFISSDANINDPQRPDESDTNPAHGNIPLTPLNKAHTPREPNVKSEDDDAVLVRAGVHITTENREERIKDPFQLPPLG